MGKRKIGEVFHYYPKPQVAAIRITEDALRVGDDIRIEGHTTDLAQRVESMEIDREAVESAKAGQEVGIRVESRVRAGDVVYRAE